MKYVLKNVLQQADLLINVMVSILLWVVFQSAFYHRLKTSRESLTTSNLIKTTKCILTLQKKQYVKNVASLCLPAEHSAKNALAKAQL